MFEGLKQRWAEAGVETIAVYVSDILQRYDRLIPPHQHWVQSAFEQSLSISQEFGPIAALSASEKRTIAKGLLMGARAALKTPGNNLNAEATRIGASGTALASYYVELQSLEGRRASEIFQQIENWRRPNFSDE